MNRYVYNFTDHLGNVRLSYSDISGDGIIQPRQYNASTCTGWFCIDDWRPGEIVESNNYYPFGLLHNYTATTQNAYQYKYNGKELQETGMYDYGARFYMPDLGRWGVVDPLAEKSRKWSTYTYAYDNPIRFIDPDGRFAIPPDDYIDVNGRYLGSDGASTKNVRVINRSKWNDTSEENGGSLSAKATQALQASSSIVTINDAQINSDINNANNETIADQTKERQVWIGINVTRGDIPTAEVTSVRGPDGKDGETIISTTSLTDKSGNTIKTTFGDTKLILGAQAHTHNVAQATNSKTLPGTSTRDADTSKSFKIPIYAVDSYTGKQKNGNTIHRVIPNGTTNNAGSTTKNNIGQEVLNQFINKQKYP
ncbi:RHS repeat-associated core domain-containing protein [Chryseobacterium aureum]|uniref:RHS repeat-associated core domain-containing protein n=1 Tax=Chryseobacterium aureum TaxID=2497456 RepID=UPI001E29E370|nr:RHS repeat-associated core domain-containing protein [Chryseobacterium aureum]